MRRVRGWMAVVVLCCAARAVAGKEKLDAGLTEAQTAHGEASTLWDAGQYADAIARDEHALALREAVLGGSHPDVPRSLSQLGLHYLLQGNPVRAEPLLQRALAIREAALGKSHYAVAYPVVGLGNVYLAQGLYARAEPFLQRALDIRQAHAPWAISVRLARSPSRCAHRILCCAPACSSRG